MYSILVIDALFADDASAEATKAFLQMSPKRGAKMIRPGVVRIRGSLPVHEHFDVLIWKMFPAVELL